MTSASPGVVALFFENQYYTMQEAYVMAVAEAMKPDYEAICQAGITLHHSPLPHSLHHVPGKNAGEIS
jgi:hypothetical protein